MSSKPIDEKIAKLSLDSDQFEQNATQAMKTFGKMDDTFSKGSNVDFGHLESSVDSIANRFTLLGNIGQAAFQRIAGMVMNAAGVMNNFLGVGGARDGYAEYEQKLGSIQTIMVNTGESIDTVSDALNELNLYADKTVYSFSDMTRNIGLFTAAGVDLKTSVSSIKGISNLAAGMGVDNTQAARATWQLSQALGSGVVQLRDWMSVENAGLGGQYFQKALVEHANKIGTLSMSYEELTKKYGSFRNSLTEGKWLTTDVLSATLDTFSTDEALMDAATKVKSFRQLMETVQESIGSGWAQTWEIIFGNLVEAKEFWSPIAEAITNVTDAWSEGRNKWLQSWKDLGGLQATLNGIKNILTGLKNIFTPIKDGFKELIPDVTPRKAADLAKSFEKLTKAFAEGDYSKFTGIFTGLADKLANLKNMVSEFISGIKLGDIFEGIKAGAALLGLKKLGDLVGAIINKLLIKKDGLKKNISETLESVGEAFENFSSGLNAGKLVTIAAAIGILTLSIAKLSTINPTSVAGSITAIGVMMGELVATLALVQKSLKALGGKGLIKASIAMIALAAAMNILASAVVKLSNIHPSRIAQGLVSLGVAMAEMVTAMKVMDGVKVKLSSAITMIALAEACKILADAVTSFSGLSWDEIGRGLTGMGGALAELVAAASILGKFGGLRSVAGATAVLIMAQALKPIQNALASIGTLNWETLKKGLTGMGIALTELAVIAGVLGKFAGFSSMFGATSILILVQALVPIQNALASIGSLSWTQIEKGLVGMGGALAELGVIAGVVGKLAGISGLLGGGAIVLAAQSLEPIASALERLGLLEWDQIGRGLTAMGGALAELSIAAGATGYLTGFAGVLGGGAIALVSTELPKLADALAKFGEMDWETIKRGLAAMGGALAETGLGGFLNTFAGFGADAIATMAEPLGTLATSVGKWADVTIPEGLGAKLGELAQGVQHFTFSGWGSDAISTVAKPLGVMADSVSKWEGVSIPEGIDSDLEQLATGVSKFTYSGFGASAISTVAKPLGDLATSMSRWANVTIPDGIGNKLTDLSTGVKSFTTAGFAGMSIDALIEPLKSFATTMKSWAGVNIPDGIGDKLSDLAVGIRMISGAGTDAGGLENFSTITTQIVDAVSVMSGIDFATPLTAMNEFVTGVSQVPGQLSSLGSSMSSTAEQISSAFGEAFVSGIDSSTFTISAAVTSLFLAITAIITSNADSTSAEFNDIGMDWITQLIDGMSSMESQVTSTVQTIMTSAANATSGYSSLFYTAGVNAMQGLANGISAGGSNAINAAARVAGQALQAAKDKLDINSPSREFAKLGEYSDMGLAQGFINLKDMVLNAVHGVAEGALSTMESDLDNQSYAMQPTISPVMDYSTMEALRDFNSSARLSTLIKDMTDKTQSDNTLKIVNLLQSCTNKIDIFMAKLEDVKLYLHINGMEVDGESLTDAIDEVRSIRDLLTQTGKGS